ncbi:MAG: hypothetical protein QNJ64_07985 [Crocosphaera sp.]|nr:hypothetical protein [Crocosphaera sp.]
MTKKSLSDLLREETNTTSETIEKTPENPTVPNNRSRMTKAQLDELITKLNQALDTEKKQVNHLKIQVKTLEDEIKNEKTLTSRLQTELKEGADYQSQLSEQKELVEKLYTQLQQKEELVIELAEKNELITSLQTQLQETSNSLATTSSSESEELVVQETALTRQAKELEPFSSPAISAKPLTNDDIGWFD